jgi:hypothetical protein
MSEFWKEDWSRAKQNLTKWWKREGPAVCVFAKKDKPWADLPRPVAPDDLATRWCDPAYRFKQAEYDMSRTFFGGEAFPYFDTQIGPGSLGTFVGSEPGFAPDTVWYQPCISDPEACREIRFDAGNAWFGRHMALIDEGVANAAGRFLVGIPDLIENIDTLAQLRDAQTLLVDLLENPRWVKKMVTQINRVYFEAFDLMYDRVKDQDNGNAFCAFRIWGPGKTAKLQCDASAMFSLAMYEEFVVPALTEQCRWLDYSLYHLDGTQAVHQLDALLKIDALDGIEWTPQAGIENGGNARWYPMYKRILDAGKCVQAIGVTPEEVKPLLDACGGAGLFINVGAKDESEARRLVDLAEKYR